VTSGTKTRSGWKGEAKSTVETAFRLRSKKKRRAFSGAIIRGRDGKAEFDFWKKEGGREDIFFPAKEGRATWHGSSQRHHRGRFEIHIGFPIILKHQEK